jgi:hypothetical protein
VLIHFPLALFITAVAFDYLAQWTKNRTLAAAVCFNLRSLRSRLCQSWRPVLQRGNGRLRGNNSKGFC